MCTRILATLLLALAFVACRIEGASPAMESIYLGETPTLDSAYARGVSGHFAFTYTASSGITYLVMGGGCNFPDLPPSRGGKKRYYSEVYRAPLTDHGVGSWELLGHLPRPCAYAGMDIVTLAPDSVYVTLHGGETPTGDTPEKVWLWVEGDSVQMPRQHEILERFGPIEHEALQPHSGVAVASRPETAESFLVGGRRDGKLSTQTTVYGGYCDYETLDPYPGDPRLKVVAWATLHHLYMIGSVARSQGADTARLELAGYRWSDEHQRWDTLPLPTDMEGATLGGGYAMPMPNGAYLLLGGVNGDKFLPAVQRGQQIAWAKAAGDTLRADSLIREQNAYLEHPIEWYRFNPRAWHFDPATEQWSLWGEHPDLARADAIYIPYQGGVLVVGGELKPGVRATKICLVRPTKQQ